MKKGNLDTDQTSLRKWFSSDNEELIVWFSPQQKLRTFQLCLKSLNGEKVVSWNEDKGLTINMIDDGGDSPLSNKAPIFTSETPVTNIEECENALLSLIQKEPEAQAYQLIILNEIKNALKLS